jgi:hypothetical protein
MLERARQRDDVLARPAEAPLADLRFRQLLSREDWDSLPAQTRKRFSKRLGDGAAVIYVGGVVETKFHPFGWLVAQLARVIGAPLPLFKDENVPAVVTVTEDVASSGQIWTRLYARRNGFPQIIQSSKQFRGSTGLEEHVGYGIGMALSSHRVGTAIQFRSARYFFRCGRLDLTLPRWLTPGALTVTHQETGDGRFTFTLEIVHPLFGQVLRQRADFRDAYPHA